MSQGPLPNSTSLEHTPTSPSLLLFDINIFAPAPAPPLPSVSSRSDPPEGAGDRRAEAEDSRGDGGDAQPVLLVRRQQPQPRHPTLFLQVHGQ